MWPELSGFISQTSYELCLRMRFDLLFICFSIYLRHHLKPGADSRIKGIQHTKAESEILDKHPNCDLPCFRTVDFFSLTNIAYL